MALPNFFIIGGQRCATGWIAQCLREHPEIYMANDETRFFDRHIDKGIDWWEKEFFSQSEQEVVIGEKTANYMYDASVAEKIHDNFPDAKIICCLRDPVDRLVSGFYLKCRKEQGIKTLSFDDLIKQEQDLIERGFYYQLLKPYIDLFGTERLKIVFYEDKEGNEKDFIGELYQFLGVSRAFQAPSLHRQTKPGAIENSHFLISKLNRFFFQKNGVFNYIYSKIRSRFGVGPNFLNAEQKQQLYEIYKDDISLLEKLCQRDLNIWHKRLYK